MENLLTPILVVLTPLLAILSFVVVKIKQYLDEYVPQEVIVRHENGKAEIVIQTKRRGTIINVKDYRVEDCREVLKWRLDGLGFGRYRLGRYKGKYGEVISYAVSDSGVLIEDVNGRKYYLAFKNINEVVDTIENEDVNEKTITVRK